MKKHLALFILSIATLLISFSQNANANHVVGGEIVYKYIGDSTNIAHHYMISVIVHRSPSYGNPFNTGFTDPRQICIRSSCFPQQTITALVKPGTPPDGIPVPGLDECVDNNSPDFTEVFEYRYTGVVILNGPCSDWRFSHMIQPCCRMLLTDINNYVGAGYGPGTGQNYLEARLNNTLGNNTSGSFLNSPAKAFCTNNFFSWSQGAYEPDNDSLEYELITAMNGANCGPGVQLTFAPGYTADQPLDVAAGTQLVLHQNGLMQFTTSSAVGNYVVVLEVKEYRLHSSGNFYYEVGSVMREMLINIVGTCLPALANGPEFDFTLPGIYYDMIPTSALNVIGNDYNFANADSTPDPNSPTGYSMEWPVIETNCFDSVITLHFYDKVQCPSITSSASEFRLVDPDSNLVPFTGVTKNCDAALETQKIDLRLHQPLAEEGDYYMYVKEGTDGNTILNSCGFPMKEFHCIVIRVIECPEPEYDIKNVSVVNNDHIEIFWEADTNSSFPLHAVSAWHFFRSDDQGATFNKINQIRGVNVGYRTSWLDNSVDHDNVNSQTYQYELQMEVSGKYFMVTRDISSIFLQKGQGYGQNGNYPLKWNQYDGWASPEYNLMIWDINSTGLWSMVTQPGNPTSSNDINFMYDLISDRKGQSFAFRIDAKDPGSTGIDYTASSNYIYINVPLVPPPPPPTIVEVDDLVIPNVFTPDGNGINDVYAIKGIEGFRSAEVIVTNRWGNVVFRDDNFTKNNKWDGRDIRTGKMVADGAYFYIVRLRGSVIGLPDVEESGNLTIFGTGSR